MTLKPIFDFESAELLNTSQEKRQTFASILYLKLNKFRNSYIVEKTRAGKSLRFVSSLLENLEIKPGEIISNGQMKGLPLTQEIWDEQKM